MIFSREATLEDAVVEVLLREPATMKTLRERLLPGRPGLSLRAVYKAASNLKEAGVVVKTGKTLRVDQEWVRGLRSNVSGPTFPLPSAGERLSYRFSALSNLDAFWKTVVLSLEEHERDGQVFFYNPHDFWFHLPGRRESEDAYYRHFAEQGIHAFFTLGGTTEGDKAFKRAYQNDFLQIDTNEIPPLGRRNHLTLIGDLVITVRVSEGLASKVDDLYARAAGQETLISILSELCPAEQRTRMTLELDPLKAKKLRKILSKNFYFRPQNA